MAVFIRKCIRRNFHFGENLFEFISEQTERSLEQTSKVVRKLTFVLTFNTNLHMGFQKPNIREPCDKWWRHWYVMTPWHIMTRILMMSLGYLHRLTITIFWHLTSKSQQTSNQIKNRLQTLSSHIQNTYKSTFNNLYIFTIVFHFRHTLFLQDLLIHLFFSFHMSDHHLAKGLSLSLVHDFGMHYFLHIFTIVFHFRHTLFLQDLLIHLFFHSICPIVTWQKGFLCHWSKTLECTTRNSSSLPIFRSKLKTHVFKIAFPL